MRNGLVINGSLGVMVLLLLLLLLLWRRYRMMGVLLCWHAVCGHVAVLWPHLLLIPQCSGSEVG